MSCIDRRVWKTPSLIEELEHGFDWVSDDEINDRLLLRYRNYDYLTPSETANVALLQRVIAEAHEYIDKLYATTLLEYEPLWNYDMHESGGWTDEKHKGTKASTNTDVSEVLTPRVERTTLETGFGFDSDANGTPVGKTTDQAPTGTDTKATTGNATNNFTKVEDIDADHFDKDVREFNEYHKFGNLGTTKTQDLLEAERKVIIDVVDIYIERFKRCFNISSHIAFEPFEEVQPDEP